MERWPVLAGVMAVVIVAGVASGQDAIDSPAQASQTDAAVALKDPDAVYALEAARAARQRAACLERAASGVEAAARQLDQSADKPKALEALIRAEAALGKCDAPKRAASPVARGVEVGPASVETPLCEPSDPLCSDIQTGSIDVVDTVKAKRTNFRVCYEKARQKNPRVRGQMSVSATLAETADGKNSAPGKIDIESDTIDDAGLTQCIQRGVQALRFDKQGAGSVVRFSLQLQPGG